MPVIDHGRQGRRPYCANGTALVKSGFRRLTRSEKIPNHLDQLGDSQDAAEGKQAQ